MYMYNNVFEKEERIGLIFCDLSDGMFKKMCLKNTDTMVAY